MGREPPCELLWVVRQQRAPTQPFGTVQRDPKTRHLFIPSRAVTGKAYIGTFLPLPASGSNDRFCPKRTSLENKVRRLCDWATGPTI